MITTALINTLGVATWYLLGIAYTSVASRHWPYEERFRNKWSPRDIFDVFEQDPPNAAWEALSRQTKAIAITLAFFTMLTLWPVSIYKHAKRGFRTKKGNHAE